MDPIKVFPAEIISDLILPYLDLAELCTLRGVSRAWQDFVNEHFAIIKRLDLTDVLDLISEVGCQSIFKHLLKLQDVCLDKCWRIATKNNLITLLSNCSDLRSYSSRRCKHVDDEVLELMARNCSKLESVDISHCFQITDSGVIQLFKNCNSISAFSTAGNYGFTDEAVKFMGMYCKNLEELDCGSCFQVTDIGLKALLEGKCMQLSYVRIKGCLKVSEDMTQRLVERDIEVNNCY